MLLTVDRNQDETVWPPSPSIAPPPDAAPKPKSPRSLFGLEAVPLLSAVVGAVSIPLMLFFFQPLFWWDMMWPGAEACGTAHASDIPTFYMLGIGPIVAAVYAPRLVSSRLDFSANRLGVWSVVIYIALFILDSNLHGWVYG